MISREALRRELTWPGVADSHVIPGHGAECKVADKVIRAGSLAFLAEHNVRGAASLVDEADRSGATAVLVAEDDRLIGAILLRDRMRDGIKEAVAELKSLNISYQLMLTGDRQASASAIGREAGIPNIEAGLLPEQKLDRIRQLTSLWRFIAMAGDGLNDAPALAAAHVGIAVAGANDITAEAADVVYLGQSLDKLPKLFQVSRHAVNTAWQNIFIFAGLFNVAAVALAAAGILTPIGAAFTHQLSSFFVMINSLRLLRVERAGTGRWAGFMERTGAGRTWDRLRHPLANFDFRDLFAQLLVRRRQYARPALIAIALLIVLSGLHTIAPGEIGIVERFGRRLVSAEGPGLHYRLPSPLDRLTRIKASAIRTVEIGFRSTTARAENEPAAYEWNVQHRSGRFQRKPEESLMLTGDQTMMEANAVIHYRVVRPEEFLLRQLDGDTTVRASAASAMTSVATTTTLDDILTTGRKQVEARVKQELQSRLDRYAAGVEILHVQLLDVHPSLEVVDAFREVSGAYEEKSRLISEAEGYRNEQVALSRGNAKALIARADGYSAGKKNRARGDAGRFALQDAGYRSNPGLTGTRMYLETMEQILPGRRKMIVDSGKGRRHILMLEDGVELPPPGAALLPQPSRFPPE